MARTLVPGGWLHVATDHDEYWTVIEPLVGPAPRIRPAPRFGGPEFPIPTTAP